MLLFSRGQSGQAIWNVRTEPSALSKAGRSHSPHRTCVLDRADRAPQFGKAAQPADRGITGIGPFRFREIVEHAMAVIGPEHDPVFR